MIAGSDMGQKQQLLKIWAGCKKVILLWGFWGLPLITGSMKWCISNLQIFQRAPRFWTLNWDLLTFVSDPHNLDLICHLAEGVIRKWQRIRATQCVNQSICGQILKVFLDYVEVFDWCSIRFTQFWDNITIKGIISPVARPCGRHHHRHHNLVIKDRCVNHHHHPHHDVMSCRTTLWPGNGRVSAAASVTFPQ